MMRLDYWSYALFALMLLGAMTGGVSCAVVVLYVLWRRGKL